MDAIHIATDRIVLDDFVDQPGDLACVEAASADPGLRRGTTLPATFTTEAGRDFIERQQGRRLEGVGWSLAIRHARSLQAVGQIGLWVPELRKGRVEIGYWVVPDERSKGYASAALDALSDWAFEHLDIGRVTLSIEPGNVASLATARRAGFQREALLRNWQYLDGEAHDLIVLGRFRATAPPPAPDIRRFDLGDRAAVIALWQRADLVRPQNDPNRDIDIKLSTGDGGFLVAVDDAGEVVGSVMAGFDGHRGWINYLAVSPSAQRSGLGRRLMETAARHLDALGCPKIDLQVRAGNADAVAFYESLGYTTDDVTSLGYRLD